jgi:hypothetical protein
MKGKKPSVYDLLQTKGERQLLELHVDDEIEAAAAEVAGCEVDEKLRRIRAGGSALGRGRSDGAFIRRVLSGTDIID